MAAKRILVEGLPSKKHPLWAIHKAMKQRVLLRNHPCYHRYGGRGITVCNRWRYGENGQTAFQCFVADMGPRPDGYQIDREDNDGDYTPENCRWVTPKTNVRNSSGTKLTVDSVRDIKRLINTTSRTLASIAKEYCVHPNAISMIKRNVNWSDVV